MSGTRISKRSSPSCSPGPGWSFKGFAPRPRAKNSRKMDRLTQLGVSRFRVKLNITVQTETDLYYSRQHRENNNRLRKGFTWQPLLQIFAMLAMFWSTQYMHGTHTRGKKNWFLGLANTGKYSTMDSECAIRQLLTCVSQWVCKLAKGVSMWSINQILPRERDKSIAVISIWRTNSIVSLSNIIQYYIMQASTNCGF